MKKNQSKFKAVLTGCGGMGIGQAKIIKSLPDFLLTAVCDRDILQAKKAEKVLDVKAYADFSRMMLNEKPHTVSITTPNTSHASLTLKSLKYNVEGIYCEKPMAANLKDAKAMVKECRKKKVSLVINHQRRLGPDLIRMRKMIEQKELGDIQLIRGQCQGDILSDGTHLVDSILYLAGDGDVEWVFGQVHRMPPKKNKKGKAGTGEKGRQHPVEDGYRYGHAIETGGMAILKFQSGLRVEIFCGDMVEDSRAYQDYEVIGTKARLWRTGDLVRPNLFILDQKGGNWAPSKKEWPYRPFPGKKRQAGLWQPVEIVESNRINPIAKSYKLFARMIKQGIFHPMNGDNALRGFEIVMAIYESARLHKKIFLPLKQEKFPMEMMMSEK